MTRRAFALGAAIATMLMLTSAPAFGQGYTTTSSLSVGDTTVTPNQAVNVRGSGYASGAQVTITFESTPVEVGRVTADFSGAFSTNVTIPSNATPGTHTLRATGRGAGGNTLQLVASVTVSGASTSGGQPAGAGSLPRTGSDHSMLLIQASAVLILAGAGLVMAMRRRETTA